jgi:hypothetical protein
MKKTLLTFATILSVLVAEAQTKTNTIVKTKIGNLTSVAYQEFIDLKKEDTTRYVYLGFQNAEYTYLSDYAGIYLWNPDKDKSDVNDFIKDLQIMIDNLGSTMYNEEKHYRVHISEKLPRLIFLGCGSEDSKRGAYTTISKKNAEQLIEWLNTTQF